MKKAFSIAMFLLIYWCIFAQTKSDTLYVAAHSGLNLRTEPGAKATKITAIPKESMVVVLSNIDSSQAYAVTEFPGFQIKGFWVEVDYKGQTGYVFSGYLIKYPPAKRHYENDTYYLEGITYYLIRLNGTKNFEDGYGPDTCISNWSSTISKEIVYKRTHGCGEGGGYNFLEFENHTLQEVYLLFLINRKWPCEPVWDKERKGVYLLEEDIHDVIWSEDWIYPKGNKIIWESTGGC